MQSALSSLEEGQDKTATGRCISLPEFLIRPAISFQICNASENYWKELCCAASALLTMASGWIQMTVSFMADVYKDT